MRTEGGQKNQAASVDPPFLDLEVVSAGFASVWAAGVASPFVFAPDESFLPL